MTTGYVPPLHRYFDRWESHELGDQVTEVVQTAVKSVSESRGSWFGLLNIGETHYPYGGRCDLSRSRLIEALDDKEMTLDYETVHEWQVEGCKDALDAVIPLIDAVPPGTNIIITGDHGELFGEKGGYGHNLSTSAEIHEKLYQVPLLSWSTPDENANSGLGKTDEDEIPEQVRDRLEAAGYL